MNSKTEGSLNPQFSKEKGSSLSEVSLFNGLSLEIETVNSDFH